MTIDSPACMLTSLLHPSRSADVKFFGSQDVLISASSDHTARIWRAGEDGAMSAAAVLKTHSAEVSLL